MPSLVLKATVAPQKICRVIVFNSDGTFNRELVISTAAYRALALKDAGPPSGVTTAEWQNGFTFASGHDFEVGDAQVQSDGALLVKHAEVVSVSAPTVDRFFRFAITEWSGPSPDKATVLAPVLATLPIDVKPFSITNGVITWL